MKLEYPRIRRAVDVQTGFARVGQQNRDVNKRGKRQSMHKEIGPIGRRLAGEHPPRAGNRSGY